MIIMSCHFIRSSLAWSIDFPGCWGENARQDTKPPGPLQQRAVWGKTRLHLPTLGNRTSIPSERHMRWGWLHLPTLGNRTSIPSERHMRSKDVMRTRVPQGENSGITEVPRGTIVGSHMEAILYKDTLFLSFYFLVFLIIFIYFSLFTFLSYRFVLSNLICLIDLSHRFVVSQWRDSTLVTPGRNNKPALGGRVSVPPDPLLGEANTVSRTYLSYTVTPTMTHPHQINKKHHSRA